MKLRYYLRGLGIGVFVTALLMGVALKGDRSLSDAEIRMRAMALGMVEGDSRTLADIQSSQTPSQSPADTSEPTETPEGTGVTPSTPLTVTPTATPSPGSETVPPKPLAMVTLKPSVTATPDPADTPSPTPEPENVTFVIRSGQSSYGVSKSLVEAGLVEDASVFDRYLEDNGYSKRISTGTYEIPMGSTQEEIAKIITRSR